jgi:hypothetical protein
MAKKNSRVAYDDYNDEEDFRHDVYQEIQERRKNKRLRNALRARDVDALIYEDEEY